MQRERVSQCTPPSEGGTNGGPKNQARRSLSHRLNRESDTRHSLWLHDDTVPTSTFDVESLEVHSLVDPSFLDDELFPLEAFGDSMVPCEGEHRLDLCVGDPFVRDLHLEDRVVYRHSSDESRNVVEFPQRVLDVASRGLVL